MSATATTGGADGLFAPLVLSIDIWDALDLEVILADEMLRWRTPGTADHHARAARLHAAVRRARVDALAAVGVVVEP